MASKVLVRPSQCDAHNGTGQAATVGIMGADPEYVEAAEKYLPGFGTLSNSRKEAELKCLYKHFSHDIHSIPQGEEEIDLSELPYDKAALVKAAAVAGRLQGALAYWPDRGAQPPPPTELGRRQTAPC